MAEDVAVRQVVEQFVEAWLEGDLDGVMACVTDDVVFSPSGPGEVPAHRGRDAVREVFASSVGDDRDITLGDLVATDDVVLGPWWYPPAADGTTLRGLDLYTVRNGKIAPGGVQQADSMPRHLIISAPVRGRGLPSTRQEGSHSGRVRRS